MHNLKSIGPKYNVKKNRHPSLKKKKRGEQNSMHHVVI
jgi:hypothetical protein